MNRQMVVMLGDQMEEAWETLRHRLDGLSQQEFFWQPVPDCWTVRRQEDGRWVIDHGLPDPDPPPFTTIAWRLVHLAACKVMYHEYAFGSGKLDWDELETPGTPEDATNCLEKGHARLRAALSGLADTDLAIGRRTNWGELWPTWRIFWTMALHDLHHGAEIGCLRDLYRCKGSVEPATLP